MTNTDKIEVLAQAYIDRYRGHIVRVDTLSAVDPKLPDYRLSFPVDRARVRITGGNFAWNKGACHVTLDVEILESQLASYRDAEIPGNVWKKQGMTLHRQYAYTIETEEEPLDSNSFLAYRTVCTTMILHPPAGKSGKHIFIEIDAPELDAALLRDREEDGPSQSESLSA
jgi:hypothetical protein